MSRALRELPLPCRVPCVSCLYLLWCLTFETRVQAQINTLEKQMGHCQVPACVKVALLIRTSLEWVLEAKNRVLAFIVPGTFCNLRLSRGRNPKPLTLNPKPLCAFCAQRE